MNGGTRPSYYNYTIEVNFLHIYFVVSVILHLDANLFFLLIYHLFIYLYMYIFICVLFIYLYIYLFILYLLFRYIIFIFCDDFYP